MDIPKALTIVRSCVLTGSLWLLGVAGVVYVTDSRAEELPKIRTITTLSLKSDNGETLNQGVFIGKITLVNFFFASCKGVCPAMQRRLLGLYQEHPELQHEQVQLLSISVDPANDTLAALRQYRRSMQLPDRWYLANTSADELRRLLVKEFALGSWEQPEFHTRRVALVDQVGSIRAYIPSDDEEHLQQLPGMVKGLLFQKPAH